MIKEVWNSALLKSTEYNSETQELVIEFNNGKKYMYKEFTQESYDAFVGAESKGKYFLSEMRPKYNDTNMIKIEEDENSQGS